MIRRVAIYARVSTRDKDQDPEVQLVPLREYAQAHGWETVEFVDVAPAGDLRRRTAWRRLLADAARRRWDAVLVWKLDRAFRSSPTRTPLWLSLSTTASDSSALPSSSTPQAPPAAWSSRFSPRSRRWNAR